MWPKDRWCRYCISTAAAAADTTCLAPHVHTSSMSISTVAHVHVHLHHRRSCATPHTHSWVLASALCTGTAATPSAMQEFTLLTTTSDHHHQ